jgi:hypothetical protein
VLRRVEVACSTTAVLGIDGDPFRVSGFTARLDLEEYRLRSDWRYRYAVLQRHALSRLHRALQSPGRGRRDEPAAP